MICGWTDAAADVKDYPITETWALALSHSPQGPADGQKGREGEKMEGQYKMVGGVGGGNDGKRNEREIG